MLPSLTHAFIKDGVALTDLSPFDKGVQTINVYTTPNHKNFGDLVKNFFFRPLMAAKAKKAIVDSLKQYHDDDGIADLINEIKKSSLLEGVNYSALKIRLANACLNGLRLGEECPDFLRNIADEGVSNYFADEEKIYENVHFLNGIGTIKKITEKDLENYCKNQGNLTKDTKTSIEDRLQLIENPKNNNSPPKAWIRGIKELRAKYQPQPDLKSNSTSSSSKNQAVLTPEERFSKAKEYLLRKLEKENQPSFHQQALRGFLMTGRLEGDAASLLVTMGRNEDKHHKDLHALKSEDESLYNVIVEKYNNAKQALLENHKNDDSVRLVMSNAIELLADSHSNDVKLHPIFDFYGARTSKVDSSAVSMLNELLVQKIDIYHETLAGQQNAHHFQAFCLLVDDYLSAQEKNSSSSKWKEILFDYYTNITPSKEKSGKSQQVASKPVRQEKPDSTRRKETVKIEHLIN